MGGGERVETRFESDTMNQIYSITLQVAPYPWFFLTEVTECLSLKNKITALIYSTRSS